MVSSDSDYYESADEEAETPNLNRSKRKVVNKPTAGTSNQGADNVDDGWEDFDIEGDLEEERNLSLPPPPLKTKVDASGDAVDCGSKDATAASQVTETGWGDFEDWGDTAQQAPSTSCNISVAASEQDKVENITKQMSEANLNQASNSTWGWSGWGVGSILDTATNGISTLTSHMSQGISTVANVLESGIGAPEPEELAKQSSAQETQGENQAVSDQINATLATPSTSQNEGAFALNSIISGVNHITKFVESTGTKVIAGGLDTLETIGKKTMEVLQDGDPGLQKKRAMLGLDSGEKPVLSQILREAKEKADEEDKNRDMKREAKQVHYETLFDDCEGLVNLEALEMLSRQVSMQIEEKLNSADTDRKKEIKETLQQVNELCDISESDDEEGDSDELNAEQLRLRLNEATSDIGVEMHFDNILGRYERTLESLSNDDENRDGRSIFKSAVSSLASVTAEAVVIYRLAAQLLLVGKRRSTADEADSLAQLTKVLSSLIRDIARRFVEALSRVDQEDENQQSSDFVANIYLEAENSKKYIENAFQLTIPVVQFGAV